MESRLDTERVARRLATAAARGRIADIAAVEETLTGLNRAVRHATEEVELRDDLHEDARDANAVADRLLRLRAAASLVWSVLAAGTVDVLDDDPLDEQADMVATLREVAPHHLDDIHLGRIAVAKRLWDALGFDTAGWAPWPDVEPGHPPVSVADLDIPGLVGLHVEIDVAGHPEGAYLGRLVAARDDHLVLTYERETHGEVTLVPTDRVLAVRVVDEQLPWRLQDEIEEMQR